MPNENNISQNKRYFQKQLDNSEILQVDYQEGKNVVEYIVNPLGNSLFFFSFLLLDKPSNSKGL
jgi:hypothetical protein